MNSAAKWQKKKKKSSPVTRDCFHPLFAHILCSQWWSGQWEVPLAPRSTLGAQHFMSCHSICIVFSHVEKVKAFFTEKKEKDPWMSSFILCFHLADVGIFVIDMHLQTSLAKVWVVLIFHYDYLLFLLSWLLTFLSDSNVYFMGSSLPMSFLLHTVGLSLYFKKLKIKKRWNCH